MSVDEFRAKFAEAAKLPVDEPETTPAEPADTVEVEEPEELEVETPDAPEDAPPEPVDEEPPDEDAVALAAYLEKYGGDTDKALKAAVEAQKIIGRQSAEVSEARKVSEQLAELQALMQTPAEPEAPSYDQDALDAFLVENPHQIPLLAQQALDSSDGVLYGRALAAWSELDAVGAMDFHARAVSAAEIAQLRQEMQPALQSVAQAQTTNQFAVAFEAAAQNHPDFAQVMNAITAETMAGFPKSVLGHLQTGDQATKQEVLETLYRWTKAEQAGNLSEAAGAATRQTQNESRAARTEAAVASTTTSQPREAQSNLDAFHEQFQASDAFRKAAGLIP